MFSKPAVSISKPAVSVRELELETTTTTTTGNGSACLPAIIRRAGMAAGGPPGLVRAALPCSAAREDDA